jgi:hypothetical protein
MQMNRNTYIARANDVAVRLIGDELMIMSSRTSALFSLNETAAILWQAADGTTPLGEIVEQQVCTAFDVDIDTALIDAQQLAEQLAEHGILRFGDQPLAQSSTTAGA